MFKKDLLIAIAAAVFAFAMCIGIARCTSEGPVDFNKLFLNVYNRYASNIIMDDSTSYVVQSGDTLSKISVDAYGSGKGYYFPLIMLASRETVADPDLIAPGMELTIPNLEANLRDEKAKDTMKTFFKEVAGIYERKENGTMKNALIELSESGIDGAADELLELVTE